MPQITLRPDQPFSLDSTLGCGQVFRWNRTDGGWWYGVVGDRVIRCRQEGAVLTWHGAGERFIRHYFALDLDLPAILSSIDSDPTIHAAIIRCEGLRLVRQPAWECLCSYICATNSNIPVIRRRIAALAEQFGRRLNFEGRDYYTFPDPAAISCTRENHALTACRLGYRTTYVFETACRITITPKWEKILASLPYEEARQELMNLPGIGPKAADCTLLFAFQKYEAFPVDVWIRRIIREHYIRTPDNKPALTIREYDNIRRFARQQFGNYCGFAQEYLYAAREG
jgi:N-glycosylase/DNA lyase